MAPGSPLLWRVHSCATTLAIKVRFPPDSGHAAGVSACPLCAMRRQFPRPLFGQGRPGVVRLDSAPRPAAGGRDPALRLDLRPSDGGALKWNGQFWRASLTAGSSAGASPKLTAPRGRAARRVTWLIKSELRDRKGPGVAAYHRPVRRRGSAVASNLDLDSSLPGTGLQHPNGVPQPFPIVLPLVLIGRC
jgi:hypothetical protein